MEPGELPPDEGDRTGDQEGICDKDLRPEGGFDTPCRVENENRLKAEVNPASSYRVSKCS